MSTIISLRQKIGEFYIDYYLVDGKDSSYPPRLCWSWGDFTKELVGKKVLEVFSGPKGEINILLEDMRLVIQGDVGQPPYLRCNGVDVVGVELGEILE